MPSSRVPLVAITALALLLLSFCGGSEQPQSLAGYNVVLITIDTIRADRIGAYGSKQAVTPNLDALAGEGVRFENAESEVPLTLPSHSTILSGMHPHRHGVRNNGVGAFPDDKPTLATLLSSAGYRTAAFVGAFVLDHRFGLGRGFDVYDDEIERDPDAPAGIEAERPASAVIDRAISWLGRSDPRPFFLWVHLYDPHAPYAPPEPYRTQFAGRLYDGEIAYVDAQLGRLRQAIRDSVNGDRTVFVVMGDHGEALGEHGELTHGVLLYEPTLRVPLIISAPRLFSARTVTTPVSLADVAPTLASLLSIEKPQRADGVDLSAELIAGKEPAVHNLYAETQYPTLFGWSGLESVRRGSMKLIQSPAPELYDLARDPQETRNVYTTERRSTFALKAALDTMRADAAPVRAAAMDDETARKLASLGYLGGAPAASTSERPPSEVIHLFSRFEQATWALNEGRLDAALEQFRSLVRDDPGNAVFRGSFAKALKRAGRINEALEVYRESVALRPDDPEAWYNLAAAFQDAGEHVRAAEAVREAIRRDPRRPEAHNVLGVAYSAEGKPLEALAEFDKAIALDPRNSRAMNNRGNVLRDMGRFDEAERAYRRAIDIAPAYADPWNGIGAVEIARDRPREAVAVLNRAVELAPGDPTIRLNRAVAFQLAGDAEQALTDYRWVVATTASNREFAEQRRGAAAMIAQLAGTVGEQP
jgi:arylsulfatase A-like enzyme/Tfp pilus assembly protein PilF